MLLMSISKEEIIVYKCNRCDWKWTNRTNISKENKEPKLCANCKSPYWNSPRKIIKKKETGLN